MHCFIEFYQVLFLGHLSGNEIEHHVSAQKHMVS